MSNLDPVQNFQLSSNGFNFTVRLILNSSNQLTLSLKNNSNFSRPNIMKHFKGCGRTYNFFDELIKANHMKISEIDLSNISLNTLPEFVFLFVDATRLDLSHNLLKELNIEKLIKFLPKLKEVNLEDNGIPEKALNHNKRKLKIRWG